ncbi:MAG: HDOD domain-containing protein [Deltaproteobacteria bacterium]|nr:HDOD domain-containing protein [Deltaproteobacteria bacterium]
MKDPRTQKLLEQLESGYSLPTLSPISLKLVDMASDEKSSANDLVRLIEKDPPLAVRLLKLANSAFFSSVHPSTTLNQAVVKVGFNRLRIMALSISLRDTFPMGTVGPLDYETFWRVSLYRALISKSLAESLKTVNPDEAFVAGLIMEIGFLIFFDLFVKGKNEDALPDLEPLENLLVWEMKRYDINHRQVGEAALRYWNFPENIIICQRPLNGESSDSGISDLIKICELARSFSGILSLESQRFHSIYEEAERYLGLKQDKISDILITIFGQVEEIANNLKVEVDRERDLMAIMEKANMALSQISEKVTKGDMSIREDLYPSFDDMDECGEIVTHTLQAVAHEIRNPLLAVGGFARKLSTSVDPASEGGRYLHIILEEASRLEKVLAEMTRARE